jgi:CspA family cold shock protein
MSNGTVKFFNEAKGFGFIVDNTSQEEIFVHVTGLIDNIREGDKVTFNTERGKKGMNAIDVKVAE